MTLCIDVLNTLKSKKMGLNHLITKMGTLHMTPKDAEQDSFWDILTTKYKYKYNCCEYGVCWDLGYWFFYG